MRNISYQYNKSYVNLIYKQFHISLLRKKNPKISVVRKKISNTLIILFTSKPLERLDFNNALSKGKPIYR